MQPATRACCRAEAALLSRVGVSRRHLASSPAAARRLSLDEPRHRIKRSGAPPALRRVDKPLKEASVAAPAPPELPDAALPYSGYNDVPEASTSQLTAPTVEESSTPVVVPDDPKGLIQPGSPAAKLLAQPAIVVVRQLEMLNLFIGFEQASRFALHSPTGETVGYLLEEAGGIATTMGRQFLRTHRPFRCTVMDTEGNVIMRVQRPISLINSRITITAGPEDPSTSSTPVPVIGEARQVWAPLRRKYDLFVRAREGDDPEAFQQFAGIDSPFLAWHFDALDADGKVAASISRRWGGWGREIFTDTGQYALRFDAVVDDTANKLLAPPETKDARGKAVEAEAPSDEDRQRALVVARERTTQGLTLDQRAVLLAAACSIDCDYFSRSRGGPGTDMLMWPMIFGGGGETQPPPPDAQGEGTDDDLGGRLGDSDSSPSSSPGQPPPSAYDPDAPGANWSDAPLEDGAPMEDPWGQQQPDPWAAPGQQGGDDGSGGGWGWGGGDSGGGSSDWF